MISIWPIPVFADNYVWILQNDMSRQVVIVDPGDAGPVISELIARHLEIGSILITHHHHDHVGGVKELMQKREIPVYGPKGIPHLTNQVSDGDTIDLPGFDSSVSVLDVPGHTAQHAAFLIDDAAFVGDTLFAGGCGRIFEGTAAQMYNSLNTLAALAPETRIFCAHEYTLANLRFASQVESGNLDLIRRYEETKSAREADEPTVPSTLELELATNPFLRCLEPAIVDSASSWAKRSLKPGLETFTELRRWKDKF